MLFNEWAWLMSQVCLLRLEVVLASVLEPELEQKWRYGALKACIGISSENNSAFKGFERANGPCEG